MNPNPVVTQGLLVLSLTSMAPSVRHTVRVGEQFNRPPVIRQFELIELNNVTPHQMHLPNRSSALSYSEWESVRERPIPDGEARGVAVEAAPAEFDWQY